MKKLIIVMAAVAIAVSTAGAVSVESINASYLDSAFTLDGSGSWILSIDDTADIVVEYPDGSQYTYVAKAFLFNISLDDDLSAGGIADGLFQGGSLMIGDSGDLFGATDIDLRLTEFHDDLGMLTGTGELQAVSGSLAADFATPGKIVQLTFMVIPSTIGDFSEGFTGVSNITLTPVPEPATMCLLGLGGLMLRKKRRA